VGGTVAAVVNLASGLVVRRRLSGRASEMCEFVAGLDGPVRATYGWVDGFASLGFIR
jgi:hypothetical protein